MSGGQTDFKQSFKLSAQFNILQSVMSSVIKIFVLIIFVIFVIYTHRNLFLKSDSGEVKFATIWLYGGRLKGLFACIGTSNWVVAAVFSKMNVLAKTAVYSTKRWIQ